MKLQATISIDELKPAIAATLSDHLKREITAAEIATVEDPNGQEIVTELLVHFDFKDES